MIANDGQPHAKVCDGSNDFFLNGYCSVCGWHMSYHLDRPEPNGAKPVRYEDGTHVKPPRVRA